MKKITPTITEAYNIAVFDLRRNYGKEGIYAGPKKFHEYWARDSFFASYGSLTLGDYKIVKKNLNLFTKHQNLIGHIPVRVEERVHALGLFGINIHHRKPLALFRPSQPWAGKVVDSNPLYLISLCEYVVKTQDFDWVKKNEPQILKAISWIARRFDENDLVTEGYNAGWADFTFKRGNVFYTNVLVWKAFKLLCDALPKDSAQYCIRLTQKLEKSIAENFWNERDGYFIDHIGLGGVKHGVFSSDGNLLSILFGFATLEQSKRILDFIDSHNLNRVPVPIYFRGVDWQHKLLNRLLYPNYNTDNTFLWWGSISAVCRLIVGDRSGALRDLNTLSRIIIKHKSVPEIVDPNGDLPTTFFYKSELSSSWAAGMFVYACKKLKIV